MSFPHDSTALAPDEARHLLAQRLFTATLVILVIATVALI
jgi:hypothetical protein